jgi:hypothetical protein
MRLKTLLFALVVLSFCAAGFAADVRNAVSPAADGKPSPSGASSYYQGVWVGKWGWTFEGGEVTITVGGKNKDGLFGIGYSVETGRTRTGFPLKSVSFKAWGKEQGDGFLIEFKNKDGVKSSVTLTKETEDSVKGVYDSEGRMTWIRDKADCVAYFKRK